MIASVPALDPNAHVTGRVGLDVNDARPTTRRAVFDVRLLLSASEVDGHFVERTAKRTHDLRAIG